MAKKFTRLYVSASLSSGVRIRLSDEQAHYLMNVLRMKDGQNLQVFNEGDGNWTAHIQMSKKIIDIMIDSKSITPSPLPPLHLYFPAIKKHRLSWLIEKATELGVTAFHPIMTERTHQPLPNTSKLQAIAIEASEQSERVEIPKFHPVKTLREALELLPSENTLYVGREQRDQPSLLELSTKSPHTAHIMIGPEGGFTDEEFSFMEKYPFVRFMTLSEQVLRTETAALAALSIIGVLNLSHARS